MRGFLRQLIFSVYRTWFYLFMVILLVLLAKSSLFAKGWEQLQPGLAIREINEQIPFDNSIVNIHVVRIDPKKFAIKVIDVFGRIRKGRIQFPVYSLREITHMLNPVAIINGGFSSSYSFPFASGLVLENNKIVGRLNEVSTLQNGIFLR